MKSQKYVGYFGGQANKPENVGNAVVEGKITTR